MISREQRAIFGPTYGHPPGGGLGIVLTGGGARGAYQVGVMRALARHLPSLRVPIVTGVSAGAVNSARLAQHGGLVAPAAADLERHWRSLTVDQVFRAETWSLVRKVFTWGSRLTSGGMEVDGRTRGLVDTAPLREFLRGALDVGDDGRIPGIAAQVASGALRAAGIITTDYATGESITWIEGNDQCAPWVRPQRRGVIAQLGLDHVMASTALPFFFPAVRVGDRWHGDGGIRLTSPLQPALALGADRIIVISTRPEHAAPAPASTGYPAPAQVLGVLYNAVFVDNVDEDVHRLRRTNALLDRLPEGERDGLRKVEMLVVRPSRDPGSIARDCEHLLPKAFRWLTRGLGTRDRTSSGDALSLVLFLPEFLGQLIALGEEDGERVAAEVERLAGATGPSAPSHAPSV